MNRAELRKPIHVRPGGNSETNEYSISRDAALESLQRRLNRSGPVRKLQRLHSKAARTYQRQIAPNQQFLQFPALSPDQQIEQHVSAPIQRVVAPIVMPGGVVLAGATLAKYNEVMGYLNMANLGPPAGIVVGIRVNDDNAPNPAFTRMSNSIGVDIEIDLRKWYLDITSVGEICGLLAHELGVHNLADMLMTDNAKRSERRRNRDGRGFQVDIGGGQQVGVGGWNAPPNNNRDGTGRQRDHVNVVRDAGGAAGNASARTRVYVDTMLNIGDNIHAAPAVGAPAIAARNQKLQDLLRTFLFDYARILVTDDGGAFATISNADLIAQAMNWYQGEVINRHQVAHPWLAIPAVQVLATGTNMRVWLLGKLVNYLANRAAKFGRDPQGTASDAWNAVFG